VASSGVELVELASIVSCANPVRFEYDDTRIAELAESIRQVGLLQPIVVKPVGSKYEVVAGERRYRASLRAGLTHVPAVVIPVDAERELAVGIIENVERENMNPVEEAVAFSRWLELTGKPVRELAVLLGRDPSYVHKRLAILDMGEVVLQALIDGTMTLHHALELKRVDDPTIRAYLADLVVKNGASVSVLRGWIDSYRRDESEQPGVDLGRQAAPSLSSAPMPRVCCSFCGRTADEAQLVARYVCRDCDIALREAQERSG